MGGYVSLCPPIINNQTVDTVEGKVSFHFGCQQHYFVFPSKQRQKTSYALTFLHNIHNILNVLASYIDGLNMDILKSIVFLLLLLHLCSASAEDWISAGFQRLGVSNKIVPSHQGSDASCNDSNIVQENAEKAIEKFLTSESKPSESDKFFIQGWRWHTLSVIRDSNRLQKYASRIQQGGLENASNDSLRSVKEAVNHVIGFNLKGLQRIEDDVFFPWLREKLVNEELVGTDAKKAFQIVIDSVDCDRKRVEDIASKLRSEVEVISSPDVSESLQLNAVRNVAKMSESLSSIASSIMDREDRLLVPAVTKVVSPREQKSFNNKVLRNLGIFESRCHLVGMHDAVYDSSYGNGEEQAMFVEQIPSIARMMIGHWRKSLYQPKAWMLQDA